MLPAEPQPSPQISVLCQPVITGCYNNIKDNVEAHINTCSRPMYSIIIVKHLLPRNIQTYASVSSHAQQSQWGSWP